MLAFGNLADILGDFHWAEAYFNPINKKDEAETSSNQIFNLEKFLMMLFRYINDLLGPLFG